MEAGVKVWITKYALTKGCFVVDAEMVRGRDGSSVYASRGELFTREWVETEQEAREAWNEARLKKIESLKRQIAKLESAQFKKGRWP